VEVGGGEAGAWALGLLEAGASQIKRPIDQVLDNMPGVSDPDMRRADLYKLCARAQSCSCVSIHTISVDHEALLGAP
jgi:hypothetical protein